MITRSGYLSVNFVTTMSLVLLLLFLSPRQERSGGFLVGFGFSGAHCDTINGFVKKLHKLGMSDQRHSHIFYLE